MRRVTVKIDKEIIVQNCETKKSTEPTLLTIDGKEYTSLNGAFNIRIQKKENYIITARILKPNRTKNSYKRTIKGTLEDTINVVPYNLYDPKTKQKVDSLYDGNIQKIYSWYFPEQFVLQEKNPQKFKDFTYEANFRSGANGLEYDGLKTFLQQPNTKIWIASHGPTGIEYPITRADQEAVKKLIQEEIFPTIDPKFQPEIYLEDPNNWETPPVEKQGTLLIGPIGA
jgi:hypothetical protein